MRFVGFVVGVALIAFSASAASALEPIREGDTLTGTLRLVTTRHPNGTKLVAYQIVSEPRLMPPNDDFCDYDKGATTFHLFAMTDVARKQLKPLLGRKISVKMVALFCSETAWHVGDVAVPQWTVLPK